MHVFTKRRLLAATLAGALGAATLGLPGTPAPAQAAECTTRSGVQVVVDFGSLGTVRRGCSTADPKTGLVALKNAGFTYSFVPRQPGFVCRVNELPNPCNNGPSTAYWSYWHAKPGGQWEYSSKGASTFDPARGTVEGWAFGAGKPPRVRPPAPIR